MSTVDTYGAWMIINSETDEVLCRKFTRFWFEDYFKVSDEDIVMFWKNNIEEFRVWFSIEVGVRFDWGEELIRTYDTVMGKDGIELIKVDVVNNKIIL